MNPPENHTILRAALRFLKWFCPDHLFEEIEGDLVQKFNRDVKAVGEVRAKGRLVWNVIRFFRPGIVLRMKFSNQPSFVMIPSYFKFSARNIQRHKVFSFINITGLAFGMTVCLMILNYVLFEKSYDKFNGRYQDIVRVGYTRFIDNEFQYSKAQVFPAVAEVLRNTIPEVEDYVRLFPITTYVEAILWTEENGQRKSFIESSIYAVDASFLKIFSLPLLQGNPVSALAGEKKLILSESAARKYFGDEEALNKTIHWEGTGDWLVTGVFKDLPENSHMHFDFLVSWMNVSGDGSAWNWDGFYTYLLLQPNASLSKVESLAQQVLDGKMKTNTDANRVVSKFFLQPVKDIHLHSQLSGEMQPNGNAKVVDALQIVATIILGLALINYLNLSVARTIKRAKEVGVRKIIGSTRYQLMTLFFTESFILNLIAFTIAIGLMLSLSTVFNSLAGKEVGFIIWSNPVIPVSVVLASLVLFSLLSGFYPARLLSSFSPTVVMKSGGLSLSGGKFLRKSLLVIQFLATILLVTATLIIQRQISFMQNQELGFAIHENVVIKSLAVHGEEMDSTFINKMNLFKSKIKENSYVVNATITSNIPGRENEWMGRLQGLENEKELISALRTRVDRDFIKTYGLALIDGVNFSDENPSHVILNESAVKMLGYKNNGEAIGSKIMRDHIIIGVVKDFHERSLQEPIKPSMFTPGHGYMKFITVNINSGEMKQTLQFLRQQWRIIFPDKPFDYFLLDEFFNRQYGQEQQLGEVFEYFSAIGICIACLGLFGFTYFMTHQRTKEIGIRKTLGASLLNLIRLLSSEFIFLLMLAGLSAAPLSYFLAEIWLSRYPIRMDPAMSHFILPVMWVGLLALATIIILLVRAARTNPAEALKYE